MELDLWLLNVGCGMLFYRACRQHKCLKNRFRKTIARRSMTIDKQAMPAWDAWRHPISAIADAGKVLLHLGLLLGSKGCDR